MLTTGLVWTRTTLLWISALGIAVFSWRFMAGGVEATMEHVAYHAHLRPMAFYAHVLLAPVVLALAPFQLWQGLRRTRPVIHRIIGRLYGIGILISGLSGLWLALGTQAGPVAAWGFGLLAIAWLATTGWGIGLATRGDHAQHRRWMFRSIALTLAAVSLRVQILLVEVLDWNFDTAYPAIAWLCWVPNLIIAELILNWPRRPMVRLRAPAAESGPEPSSLPNR